MNRRDLCLPLLWLGLAGLLFSFIGGIYLSNGSARNLEAQIAAKVKEKLSQEGLDWVRVMADGQKITISGAGPNDIDRARALPAAMTALGAGGTLSGGVTKVHDLTTVARTVSPYVWSAVKLRGRVSLYGYGPTQQAIDAIVGAAERMSTEGVDSGMEIASGSPSDADWVDGAVFGLSMLAGLDPGRVSLTDRKLVVEGFAADIQVVDDISNAVMSVAPPFQAETRVSGPYQWAAVLADGKLTLEGAAPEEADRAAILNAAQAAYSGDVIDRMTVGGTADWAPVAIRGLAQFAQFSTGKMSLKDGLMRLSGEAPESVYAYLTEDLAKSAGDFPVQYDINFKTPDLPELEGVNLSPSDDRQKQSACQAAFQSILKENKIYFASASARLTRRSGATLDKVMEAVRLCESASIVVEGHTDTIGGRAANIELSRRRAEAVKRYLVSAGARSDRIISKGVGPDHPIASNNTSEGRAANRRIEIKIDLEGGDR